MKYIIRGVLINGNGYAKFLKNGVYKTPPFYNKELESTRKHKSSQKNSYLTAP